MVMCIGKAKFVCSIIKGVIALGFLLNKKFLAIFSLAAVLAVAGCGASSDQNDTEQPTDQQEEQTDQNQGGDTTGDAGAGDGADLAFDEAKAQETYQSSCAGCHGANLEGGFGTELATVGARLDADAIYDIIKNGRGQMPAQGQVSDEDARNVANWLASLK